MLVDHNATVRSGVLQSQVPPITRQVEVSAAVRAHDERHAESTVPPNQTEPLPGTWWAYQGNNRYSVQTTQWFPGVTMVCLAQLPNFSASGSATYGNLGSPPR